MGAPSGMEVGLGAGIGRLELLELDCGINALLVLGGKDSDGPLKSNPRFAFRRYEWRALSSSRSLRAEKRDDNISKSRLKNGLSIAACLNCYLVIESG